jgi:hypothetical protein
MAHTRCAHQSRCRRPAQRARRLARARTQCHSCPTRSCMCHPSNGAMTAARDPFASALARRCRSTPMPLSVCRCTRAAVRSAPRTVALIRSAAEPPQIADAIAARSHDVAVTQPPVHPPPPLLHHQQAPGMAAHLPADPATPAAHPPSVTATPAAHPPSVTAAAAMASPAVESGRKGSVFSRAKEQASSLFGRQGTVRERMPLKRLVANCCACCWLARGCTAVHEMAWYPVRWYPIPHSIQCDTVAPSYIRCRMSTAEELVGRPTHCNAPLALIDRPADSSHEHAALTPVNTGLTARE